MQWIHISGKEAQVTQQSVHRGLDLLRDSGIEQEVIRALPPRENYVKTSPWTPQISTLFLNNDGSIDSDAESSLSNLEKNHQQQ